MIYDSNLSKYFIIETEHNKFTTKEFNEVKESMAQVI